MTHLTNQHNSNSKPNSLLHETSPYLLQHAYNPVEWYPWGKEALDKAKKEDKPIIVSIGYSACHWCHVMERECFENEDVASLMNQHFINIKVDREERPDVDQIYMEALQSMSLGGGWPLNVFLTPDAKPFYGGTYFPAPHWMNLLEQIHQAFGSHRADLEHSAEEFTKSLNHSDSHKYGLSSKTVTFSKEELDPIFQKLEAKFDKKAGGPNKAPKFPMPSTYLFLLRYYQITKNEAALRHIKLTLDRMAHGGIYDQIGGGFARYSTDAEWFAPHFEKMLYDNGQLLSLYSEAYTLTKNPLYKEVVYETIAWLKNEMVNPEGGFYSAQDADSEGVEGKFYVWTAEETGEILKEDASLFNEYYNIVPAGNWEHGVNILFRNLSNEAFANKHKISLGALENKVRSWKKIILEKRNKRIRPGLDDKILASWNGLMLKGLVDAYRAFDEEEFLKLAEANALFLKEKMRAGDRLFHSYKNGKATIDGYLEDYTFVMEGYIALYEAGFYEQWLREAEKLCTYTLENFYDAEEELFFFTDNNSEKLIARKKELFDNVIPASNSAMAANLFRLGILLDKKEYSEISQKMLSRVKHLVKEEPGFLSNWASLFASQVSPTAEVVISGKEYLKFRKDIDKVYHPNKVMAGTETSSDLPLLQDRNAVDGKTMVYVCYNRACKLPVDRVDKALELLQ
ncbi:MAG: thioredoxin domain-containing protein [Cytophagaceae bacterium]